MICGYDEQANIYPIFTGICNIDELAKFVDERSTRHDHYYHYSNFEAINSIDKSREFFFTKATMLNDKKEGYSLSNEIKESTYIACFSHEVDENLGQWILYGDGGNGARISFSKYDMRNFVKLENRCLYKVVTDDVVVSNFVCDIEDVEAVDIIYYDSLNGENVSLYYDDCKNSNLKTEDFMKLFKQRPFAFKPSIWKYEHETRIIVTLRNSIKEKHIMGPLRENVDFQKVMGPLRENDMRDTVSKYSGTIKL